MSEQIEQPIQPRLLGVQDAARYLGATAWFVRTLIWQQRIAFCKFGKRLLIDRADLDAFIAAHKEPDEHEA